MGKLFAIGELLIDFTATSKGKLSEVATFQKNPGGAPANVACQGSRLGVSSSLISQVGDDPFGHFLFDTVLKEGVDTTHLFFSKDHETSLAFVSIDGFGERDFTFYRKSAADLFLSSDKITSNLFHSDDILHFGSVDLVPSLMKESHILAIEMAKKQGALISFDPNLRFALWDDYKLLRKTVFEFLPLADIVKVSIDELRFLSGSSFMDEAIDSFWKPNYKALIITDGGTGAYWYYSKTEAVFLPSFAVEVVDTTGAGDAFIGTILSCILDSSLTGSVNWRNREWIVKTLRFAHAASALVVSQFGAIPALPTRAEVFAFLRGK